jgi:glycine/D-amino acid oxidase-like deaminating enzyme
VPKAVIVGAGINGLCTARGLVRRGWRVEIVERGPVPNPQAASWDRHRLIRPTYADPALARRIDAAYAAWDELWRDLGRSHYVERGTLTLSRAEGDWSDRAAGVLLGTSAELERLDPGAVADRFPMIEIEGVRHGLYAPRGGALLSDRILGDLIAWLRARGVAFHANMPAKAVDAASASVAGPGGVISGDVAILAAGVGLPALAPNLASGLVPRRCVVVYLRPSSAWAESWAKGPTWADLGGDHDLWGIPPIGDIPMKLGFGLHTRPGDPVAERRTTRDDIAAIVGAYRGRFRDIDTFEVVEAVANFYLMAREERFVLRRDRRVVLLSADSGHGFKFGPLTGETVAAAIDEGRLDAAARWLAGTDPP